MSDNNQHIKDALAEYQDHNSRDIEERKEDLRFMSLQQYDKLDPNEIQLVFDRCNRVRNRIVNPCRIHPFGFGVASGYGMPAERAIKLNAFYDRIQEESSAYSCYTDALDLALACGQGFLIIGTDWSEGDGIEQKLVVNFAKDPTSIYIDPSSEAIDGSDAENAGYVSSIGKSLAKRLYGITKDVGSNWSILPESWAMPNNSVPVVTYWSRKGIKKEVLYFQTEQGVIGMTMEQIESSQFQIDPNLAIGMRKVQDTVVDYEKWVGDERVEKTVLQTKYIPVVPVYGKRVYLGDRITYKGLPFFLRDTQKLVNFAANAEAYRLNNAPNSPFIAEMRQVSGNADIQYMWDNVNIAKRGVLLYEQVDGVPEPHRVDTNPQTMEIQATRKGLQNDLDEQMGFGMGDFGGRAGAKESSGLALSMMQEVSDYQTAGWTQNLEESVKQCGRIIDDLSPSTYKNGLEVSFTLPDGTKAVEVVNPQELQGTKRFCITTSPAGIQKKKQGAQILATLAGQSPEFALAFADVILESSGVDIPEEAIERAKKMVPAHLKGEAPDPQAMQTMQAMQEAMDGLTATNEQYEAIISQLQSKIIGDTQKAEIDYMKAQLKIIGDLLLEQQKQKGKIEQIDAQATADLVTKTAETMQKEVDLDMGNVSVQYTDPMDQFTPLVAGPLVVGD